MRDLVWYTGCENGRGLITPPIGLNCFVVAGVRDDLSVQDVFKGVTPFFIADAFTIAVLISFPGIVLWLPSLA